MGAPDVEATEVRDRFLALAQHKLNTPLAVISGWSATLQDWELLEPEERTGGLEAINRAALELQAQVEDVLDEARAHALAQSLQSGAVQVVVLVDDAIDTVGIDEDRHPVLLDVDEDVSVRGDERALRTVVRHVLDNAVRYSPDGGAIDIRVRSEGDRRVICVQDHGIGLPEDVDVFEPFRRGNHAAAVARGTGLGLHVVRSLMTAMGGEVTAVRTDDGTLVELALPTG